MIKITDQQVVRELIRHCVNLAEQPDSTMTAEVRLSLKRIGAIPLAQQRVTELKLSLDPTTLIAVANTHDTAEREKQLLRYYIKHRASFSLIKAVMPHLTRARLSNVSDNLLPDERPEPQVGRPSSLRDKDAGDVLLLWGLWADKYPLVVERLVMLHSAHYSRYTLASLYAVIQESAL